MKYLDPITKDKFITKEEYFKLLDSKEYDNHITEYNKPL